MGEGVPGHLGVLQCSGGLSSADPSGGHQPRVPQASTAARGQQQSLHASIGAEPCTDHLLIFFAVRAFVSQIVFHPQH